MKNLIERFENLSEGHDFSADPGVEIINKDMDAFDKSEKKKFKEFLSLLRKRGAGSWGSRGLKSTVDFKQFIASYDGGGSAAIVSYKGRAPQLKGTEYIYISEVNAVIEALKKVGFTSEINKIKKWYNNLKKKSSTNYEKID